jgi:hypothetical protein
LQLSAIFLAAAMCQKHRCFNKCGRKLYWSSDVPLHRALRKVVF